MTKLINANSGAGLPSSINTDKPERLYEGIEYREFWDGQQRRALDQIEHLIVRNLLPTSGYRIIDVGCGYGRLADCYKDRFQQVIMVDGSMSLLRQALENTGRQATYIACDVEHMPFQTATFDAVLMIRVFHHLQGSSSCLNEMHRILSHEGRFVFNYMNKQNPRRIVRWLLGANKENPFNKEPGGVGSTLISYHPNTIHQMLIENGFFGVRYSGAGIVDKLVGKIGFTQLLIKLGEYLAPFFGKSKIAPWIFCDAIAKGNIPIRRDANRIGDLLQCPLCGGIISTLTHEYVCLSCLRRYPVIDGIIDMRL
jgi:ubiquinone/menaquinone biosynthesis C-methylase UbiE